MQFAARMTPILYEKLRGSPRRVKRFLNDLNVRSAVAERRGIELDDSVVAKLMVLELLLSDEFEMVLDWLARGELRRQLTRLEEIAGRPVPTEKAAEVEERESVTDTPKKTRSKNGKIHVGQARQRERVKTGSFPTTSFDGPNFHPHSKTLT